ncbi:MAG: DUF1566 domain-containing protein [Deltaproteobacteria bacterium]|nr:DUF1566 domain-containing protein [Deltaproteobacteria bacterium]
MRAAVFIFLALEACVLFGSSSKKPGEIGSTGETGETGTTGGTGECIAECELRAETIAAFAYGTNPALYRRGVAITANVPTLAVGAPVTVTIAPPLPAGLALDAATGTISGTPTVAAPLTTYTVTAKTAKHEASTTLALSVAALDYAAANQLVGVGSPASLSATLVGGPLSAASATPPLPNGLTIDLTSGAIAGTPAATQALTTHAIVATSPAGDLNASVAIASYSLWYPASDITLELGDVLADDVPTLTGAASNQYSVTPALPAGLVLDASTGKLNGIANALAPQTTYTISAQTPLGSVPGIVRITIIARCGDEGEPCCVGAVCDGSTACQRSVCVTTDCSSKPDGTPCHKSALRPYDICYGTCIPQLPDTNQRKCYNDTAEIPCPVGPSATTGRPCDGPGTTFCGQDAQYGWDSKFPSSARFGLESVNPRLIRDNVSGFLWQGCVGGRTSADCSTGTTLGANQTTVEAHCTASMQGGFNSWRISSLTELQGIFDYGRAPGPWPIDPAYFPGMPTPGDLFTGYFHVALNGAAMGVTASNIGYFLTSSEGSVRCVRDGQLPTGVFTFIGGGATAWIIDDRYAFRWQGCVAGMTGAGSCTGTPTTHTWSAALNFCETLTLATKTDWRLPNVIELTSVLQNAATPSYPAFNSTPDGWFWTSTTSAADPASAWMVNFQGGQSTNVGAVAKSYGGYTRCVRGP